MESLLVRIGVADHTARLLAATPVLRRSWLGAVVALLVMTVLVTNSLKNAESPTLFLGLAPLLPLGGVALSYGPKFDPTYEMAVVAPLHGFRLLMIRTVAVLVAGLVLNGLATLALPEYGLRALGWLLPALALTTTGLALIPRLGPVLAPSLVGGGWVVFLLVAYNPHGGTLAPFTPAGQGWPRRWPRSRPGCSMPCGTASTRARSPSGTSCEARPPRLAFLARRTTAAGPVAGPSRAAVTAAMPRPSPSGPLA